MSFAGEQVWRCNHFVFAIGVHSTLAFCEMVKGQVLFPYLTWTVFFAVVTVFMLRIYSAAHWPVLSPAYSLRADIAVEILSAKESGEMSRISELEEKMEALDRIIAGGGSVLRYAGVYQFSGFFGFIISMIGLFRYRDWRRIAILPIGVFGLIQSLIIM